MAQPAEKEFVQVWMDPELKAAVVDEAWRRRMSISAFVRQVLTEAVRDAEPQPV